MASRQDRGENESDNRDNSLRALLLAAAGAGTIAAIVIVLAYVASNGQVSEAMNVTKTDPAVTPKPEAKVADKVVHDKPGYTGKEEKQSALTQPAPTQPAPEQPSQQPAPTQPAPEQPSQQPAPTQPAPERPSQQPAPEQPAPTQPAEGNDILQTLLEPLTKAS